MLSDLWLFIIDVTQESYNKGFLEAFCEGIISSLYGKDVQAPSEGEEADPNAHRAIPPGARVGFKTYDKEIHFYNMNVRIPFYLRHGRTDILQSSLEQAQMIVMPDVDDPFVPISDGFFVDPYESKYVSTLLTMARSNIIYQGHYHIITKPPSYPLLHDQEPRASIASNAERRCGSSREDGREDRMLAGRFTNVGDRKSVV